MTSLLICFGLVPFLAGRTLVALGLVATVYAAQIIFRTGRPVEAVLVGIVGAVLSTMAQVVAERVRAAIRLISDTWNEVMKRVDLWSAMLAPVGFAAWLLRQITPDKKEAVVQTASLGGRDLAVLVLVGVLAWTFAWLRARIATLFTEVPLGEVGGVQRAVFVLDVGATLLGVAVVFLAPVVGVVMMVLSLLSLVAIVLALRRFSEGARETCAACSKSLHAAATRCPNCAAPHDARQLSVFGRPLDAKVIDPAKHRLSLLAAHRCATCAEPLQGTTPERCSRCGEATFASDDELAAFVRATDVRFAMLTPAFGALGFIPVLGLGAALVLYRVSPAGALAGYSDWKGRVGVRVLRGLVLLGLSFVQPLPLIGAGATLLFISLTHAWTRRALQRQTA